MKQDNLETSLSKEEQTLLSLLKIVNEVKDEDMFNNLVYIAQKLNCIPAFYKFRIEDAYLPFSFDLYCDLRLLEERDYIRRGSLTLTEKGEKEARDDLIEKRFKKINQFFEPEEIETMAQLVYLYKEQVPKKDILRDPMLLFSSNPPKIEKIIYFFEQFVKK